MRLLVGLLILSLAACALLAAHERKPFELLIDAQSPGVWPRYAGGDWCDVNNPPIYPRTIGPREPRLPNRPDQRSIV